MRSVGTRGPATGWIIVLAVWCVAIAGCGGDDAGGGGVGSASQVIATDSPTTPWITIGEDGRVVWFHTTAGSGVLNGISMAMPDGREGYLAIDEVTGEPIYWSAEGWIVVFRDWRSDEGLVDIGVIGPGGENELVEDVSVPIPVPPPSVFAKSDQVESDWGAFFSALSVAVGGAVCAGGVIITGGAALGAVALPPAGVPLFATTAGGTAFACGSATVGFLALSEDNTAARAANDVVVTPANLGLNAGNCIGRRDPTACLLGVGDAIGFINSQVAQSESDELSEMLSEPNPIAVHCCSGPTSIAVGETGTWSARIGPGGMGPFTYSFAFAGPSGADTETAETSARAASVDHAITGTAGTYGVSVTVVDDFATTFQAGGPPVAHPSLTPFTVEVHDPLTLTHAVSTSADVGEEAVLTFYADGGPRPLSWTIDAGTTTYRGRLVQRGVSVLHAFDQVGPQTVVATFRDAAGEELGELEATVEVTAPVTVNPACEGEKRHLCENLEGMGCDTTQMDRAVGRVTDACGAAEAGRFVGVAEAYCTVTTFGSYSAATCAQQ